MQKVNHRVRKGRNPEAAGDGGLAAADTSSFWSCSGQALFAHWGTPESGLSSRQAAARLRRHGPNRMETLDEPGPLRLLLRQFLSPLVLILLFGAAISLGMREWIEAVIILAVVLGTVQEYRASTAMAALRRRLALNVRVWWGGKLQSLPAVSLVPGDLIELSAGNLIPADGAVLSANDFLVTQASMTGEPFPVEKRPGVLPAATALAQRSNTVFMGTSVRSGEGRFPGGWLG